MIKEFINQWEENKHKLEEYFQTTPQREYDSYENILRKIFELCITETGHYTYFNIDNMTILGDNQYEGVLIFIIPIGPSQYNLSDYVMTSVYYGSCSGCDTLLGISKYDSGLPTEQQVKDYMTLALHLVQKLRWLEKED